MIFEIVRASNRDENPVVENFTTLEELADFAKSVNEELIITFPGVDLYGATQDKTHGNILIFDDYIEL